MLDGGLMLVLLAAIGGPIAIQVRRKWIAVQQPREQTDAGDRLLRAMYGLARSAGASVPSLNDGTYAIERLELPEASVSVEASLTDHTGTAELRVSGAMPTGSLTLFSDQLRLGPHGWAFVGDGDVATPVPLGPFLLRFAPRLHSQLFGVVALLSRQSQSLDLLATSRGRFELTATLPGSTWETWKDLDRTARLLARAYASVAKDWEAGRRAMLSEFASSELGDAWHAWCLVASRHGATDSERRELAHALAHHTPAEVAAYALSAEDLDTLADELDTSRLYSLILAASAHDELPSKPPSRALVEGAMRRVVGSPDEELVEALADALYTRLEPLDAAELAARVPRAAARFVSRWLVDVPDAELLDRLVGACVTSIETARLAELFNRLFQRGTSWPLTLAALHETRLDANTARAVTAPLLGTEQALRPARLDEPLLFVAISALLHASGPSAGMLAQLVVRHASSAGVVSRLQALAQGAPGVTPDARAHARRAIDALLGGERVGALSVSSQTHGGELSVAESAGALSLPREP